jgi:hypothetical protein
MRGFATSILRRTRKVYMCDCRVCKLAVLYPADIDRVVQDVFEYLMKHISKI